jgi:hypothetical protein
LVARRDRFVHEGMMMRTLLFFMLALFVSVAEADSLYTVAPDGGSSSNCAMVGGVYTCTDGIDPTSTYCAQINGQLVCAADDAGSKSKAVGAIDGTNAATVAQSELQVQKGFFSDLMAWLKGAFMWLPRWIWQSILGALGAMVKAIPVPDFFSGFATNVAGLAGSVVWFLDLVQFKFGVTVVLGALLMRWLLRRIPLIG